MKEWQTSRKDGSAPSQAKSLEGHTIPKKKGVGRQVGYQYSHHQKGTN